MKFKTLKPYAPAVIRIGVALVLLIFGYFQLSNPRIFIGWLPITTFTWTAQVETLIYINGTIELILGALLLFGFLTRIASLILAIHMAAILVIGVGFNEIGVRDFGLLMAAISVFLNGKDLLCLDTKFKIKGLTW